MRLRNFTGLSLLLLAQPGFTASNDVDKQAVLALIDRAFAAISSQNDDELREIQLPLGTSLTFRPHPYGKAGDYQMRLTTNEAAIDQGANEGRSYMERWTSEPTVLIHGPIAVVWGEYEFYIDGEFSHCGIDSVDVVSVDGEWKIANWVWTVETEGCPTAP